jgi:hypothetical protein
VFPGASLKEKCIKQAAGNSAGQKNNETKNHASTIALTPFLRGVAVGAVYNPWRQFASASETIHVSSP